MIGARPMLWRLTTGHSRLERVDGAGVISTPDTTATMNQCNGKVYGRTGHPTRPRPRQGPDRRRLAALGQRRARREERRWRSNARLAPDRDRPAPRRRTPVGGRGSDLRPTLIVPRSGSAPEFQESAWRSALSISPICGSRPCRMRSATCSRWTRRRLPRVERESQAEVLLELGANQAQGFLLGAAGELFDSGADLPGPDGFGRRRRLVRRSEFRQSTASREQAVPCRAARRGRSVRRVGPPGRWRT
jgi:hypothetical protein